MWQEEYKFALRCGNAFDKDVKNALCRMKAVGPGGITADSLKFMGQDRVKRLIKAANGLLECFGIPDRWRSDLVV